MYKSEEQKKLWQEIGMEQSPMYSSQCLSQENQNHSNSVVLEKHGEGQNFNGCQGLKTSEVYQQKLSTGKRSLEDVLKKANSLKQIMDNFDEEMPYSEQRQPIEIVHQQSHIQKVIDYGSESNEKIEDIDQLYNYDISHVPESITPLVYSKTSKPIEEVRFRKNIAKYSLLKLMVLQLKQSVLDIRSSFGLLCQQMKEAHQQLQHELCNKYYQLERQYSCKLQQSVFNHKQEYQQLKYEYQVLKGRQQIIKSPIKSQIYIPHMKTSDVMQKDMHETDKTSVLEKENAALKQKVNSLELERQKLMREASECKKKISGIESQTAEVRESNDKLYEYIFDLEQKIAYHQEQIPKITKQLKEELSSNFSKQIEELDEEKQHLQSQAEQSIVLLKKVEKQRDSIAKQLQSTQHQLTELKISIQRSVQQQQRLQKLCQSKNQEISKLIKKSSQHETNYKRMIDQKEQLMSENRQSLTKIRNESFRNSKTSDYGEKEKRQSLMKQLLDTNNKEDKSWMEKLEIEKMVLQKENVHLKAAMEFYTKTYGPCMPGYPPALSPRQQTSYSIQNHYLNAHQNILSTVPESNIFIKERQLQKYQNYLDIQAKKLQEKQRQIQSDYIVKKTLQQKRKSGNSTQRVYQSKGKQDDYGMKTVATVSPRTLNAVPCAQIRKNQFCSSEAQAIIQKVKMRQQKRDTSCHSRCEHSGNCRCEDVSRGSRTSQQSNSKDYYRMNHYRPQHVSPAVKMNDYFMNEEKTSKMKLIEDKVKRLKSELKNSLSTMKN